MGFSRKPIPRGSLPVFSVHDEQEAHDLLVLACDTDLHRRFIARELVHAQTLENLEAFSHRLAGAHDRLAQSGRCRCAEATTHEEQK